MIVYRDQRRTVLTGRTLTALRRAVDRLESHPPHDALVEILIRLGVLEAGVADAHHPRQDDLDAVSRSFRAAAHAAAHLVRLSWRQRRCDGGFWRLTLAARLAAIREDVLPHSVEVRPPEGYAQYGVYPETYIEAASRCAARLRPRRAVCLGLRSIGTSLSAVVAAELQAHGSLVSSYTLRPRGHPFDRHLAMTPRLEAALAREAESLFLIVDEGPGISGSSFSGTAAALNRLGIPDDRIVFLPSWNTDGRALKSEAARARWGRHRQFTASFEEVWLEPGRLLPGGEPAGQDLSAGAWREVLLPRSFPRPAVHPQHERRKLLQRRRLLAFAGLGERGRARLARAEALAHAGFAPPPTGLVHGFLARDLIDGQPLAPGESDPCLLDTMASYLAHLRRHFEREPDADGELASMVDANVHEALGPGADRLLALHRAKWGRPAAEAPVALDGRMLPHEWLRTATGYVKVDGLDHHDDHFFPGCRDVAWDVAGTCIEFGLDDQASRRIVESYRRESGDRTIIARLPSHAVAYLAFRTGYAAQSAESLGETADGRRFAALARRYTERLRAELLRT